MVLSTGRAKYGLCFTKVTSPALQRIKCVWFGAGVGKWGSIGTRLLLWSQQELAWAKEVMVDW